MDFLRFLCLSGGRGGLLAGILLRAIEISRSAWDNYLRLRAGEIQLSPAADLRLCLTAAATGYFIILWHAAMLTVSLLTSPA